MGKLARENRLRREAAESKAGTPAQPVDTFSIEALRIFEAANQELSYRFDAVSDSRFKLGAEVTFPGRYERRVW